MQEPKLLPTSLSKETFGGYTYHLDGELVPALTVELNPNQTIFFEHHVMLWKNTPVTIGMHPMKNVMKRVFAGMPILMTQATGPGHIAFSRDGCGHIFPIHLDHGQELDVREHQFLAATANLNYNFERIKGLSNILIGSNQFFIDKLTANNGPAIVWLHGYGNVFEKVLAAGEQIDVEPGAWLYKDPSVQMTSNFQRLSTGLLASATFTCNRFTGPGRLGIQSMSALLGMRSSSR